MSSAISEEGSGKAINRKSITPKHTFDWWLKWVASVFLLAAIFIRSAGNPGLIWADMALSALGGIGWFVVAVMWRDRALMLLNAVITITLVLGLMNHASPL